MTEKRLLAIIEKSPGSNEYWLVDQDSATAVDFFLPDGWEPIKNHLIVLLDAKSFFTKSKILPHPSTRIICLSTLKRLVTKTWAESLKLKDFASGDDAVVWSRDALNNAMARISRWRVEQLAKLECQVIVATIAMENNGLPFKKSSWQAALVELEQETNAIKDQLNGMLKKNGGFLLFGDEPVDLNHHNEVKTALEDLLGIKLKGTSQSSLQDIDHQAVKLLLHYRENNHLLGTYGPSFLEKVINNRLFGHFVPIGSSSGRFACHEPNLLALPNYPLFQACLRPEPPRTLLRFDYGGFELRILASLSQDPALKEIFNNGQDIHSMVAEAVFQTEVSKTKNAHLRDQAKILNFGLIYGMGEHALAKQLKISRREAESMLKNYFKRFSQVHSLLKSLELKAKELGYGQTALGRRAYFSSEDPGYVSRIARNMPIQGTGADIVKLALCRVHERLFHEAKSAQVVNLVHDELVIECDDEDTDHVSALVKQQMESAFLSILPDVPPEVSIKR
ncbi:MAG TPA: DNA polymerase [Myxococcota bacterium]|nr:DNA polymerase [Myxococcota bacterium]